MEEPLQPVCSDLSGFVQNFQNGATPPSLYCQQPPVNRPHNEGFSALDMITFSRQVTLDCIDVIKSKDASWTSKFWAIMQIINNFMNRKAFFFVDLAFCLSFCVFNLLDTHLMNALEFYTIGALVVNAVFFWYFSYCRFLNAKT
jgi:hypothetical protein